MVSIKKGGKQLNPAEWICLGLLVLGLSAFLTYQLFRAAIFGVVLGSAKRGEAMHDVFRTADPGTFYSNVAMYALFDTPFIFFALALVVASIRAAIRHQKTQ